MELSWELHRTVLFPNHMGLLWDYHGTRDLHETCMGVPLDFHGTIVLLQDSHGTPKRFPWDFHAVTNSVIPMALPP